MKQLLVIALMFVLFSCNSKPSGKAVSLDSTIVVKDTSKKSNSALDSVLAKMHVWSYEDKPDKLTGTVTHSAIVIAKDFLDLKFPYNGENNMAALSLREKRGKTAVQLLVSKGQFNSDSDGETINVRFDSSKVETYKCDKPNDGSTTSLFIENNKKFIEELKKAKTLIIEAEFYENGNQIMEFNVAGLIWK